MPSSVEQNKLSDRRKKTGKKKPVLKRVSAWIGAIVLASLGVSLKSSIAPVFTEAINHATETGDPVTIQTVRIDPGFGEEYASSLQLNISQKDIAVLNSLDFAPERNIWLDLEGWAPVDQMVITVALVGNRADGSRIMDISPEFKCQDPLNGTLLYRPPQGAELSEQLYLDLDAPNPQALNAADRKTPYFPYKTVSLKKDEPIVLDVIVDSRRRYCTFSLKMTVLTNGQTQTENIQNNGRPFSINGSDDMTKYSAVIVGPPYCDKFVKKDVRLSDAETVITQGRLSMSGHAPQAFCNDSNAGP